MGFIKAIFYLVILGIIVAGGYWLYGAYSTNGDAPYWAELNSNLPDPLRKFSCEQIKKRVPEGHVDSCD